MIRAIYKIKAIIILLLVLGVSSQAFASEDLTLSANAPKSVEMGKQFELAFTINTTSVNDFRAPSFDNFEVLIGPSRSIKSYTSYTNGQTTSVNSLTYTYILMPKAEGKFNIGSGVVSVKGQSISSKPISINVLPAGTESSEATTGRGRQAISKEDIFINGSLSKSKLYEQEAVVLTYKIYVASVSLSGIRLVKQPDFNGFHSQEIDIADKDRWNLEHYKGRNYRTAILKQVVLFPQRSGSLKIEPSEYEVAIDQPQEIDFDSFFNMQANNTVRKVITAPSIAINVSPLPQGKPASFGGGVGKINMTSSISSNAVKANEALTIKVVVSGTGNLKLISNPSLDLPSDFEVYDPTTQDQFTTTANGISGNRVIEYVVIPRHEGNYTIPSSPFSYFDTESKSYKTLNTQAFNITVAKGENNDSSAGTVVGNYTNKEDLKLLAEDIRFIKMNDVEFYSRTEFIKGSLTYKLLFIIPSILFIGFVLLNIKRAKENSNVALVRTKKANKIAKLRMKNAEKLLKAGNKDLFYDEVLRALWGYISDKLTIPVSKLSKDNIDEELSRYGVDADLKAQFIDTLNECEFAKFAPGDASLAMDKLFQSATDIIGRMENSIKH